MAGSIVRVGNAIVLVGLDVQGGTTGRGLVEQRLRKVVSRVTAGR